MHSDQVHIELDLARDLIRDQFPQFEDEEIVALATAGTVNAIFLSAQGLGSQATVQRDLLPFL